MHRFATSRWFPIIYIIGGIFVTGLLILATATLKDWFFTADFLVATLVLMAMALPIAAWWAFGAIYHDKKVSKVRD